MNPRSLLALCLLLTGLLAHPRLLETYVVLDGHIDNRERIYAGQVTIATAGIAAAIWSRKRKQGTRSRRTRMFALLAVGLSCLFGVGLVEAVLRLRPELALEGEVLDEFQWRQRQGVAPTAYEFDSYDPELGWVPTPNFNGDGVQTNSQGIRARREFAARATPGVRRIAFVGDSFTWGEQTWHGQIRNEETFVAILERTLPAVETINLGVHGWGTDQQLLYLRRLGLRLTPDLVVLGFFELDYERNGASFYSYAKPRFVLESGTLRLVNTPVPDREEFLARPFRLPTFFLPSLLSRVVNAVLDQTKLRPLEQREAWRVTEAIFDAIARDTESAGSRLLFVDIPPSMKEHPSAIEQAAARWAKKTRTDFLSLRSAFSRLPSSEWPQLYDGHFTADGHGATAVAIADYISQHRLLNEIP